MLNWNFQPLSANEDKWFQQTKIQHWEVTQLSGYPIKFLKAIEQENNPIFNESTSRQFIASNGYPMAVNKDEDSMFSGSESFGGFGYTPSYTNIFYIPIKYFDDIAITLGEPIEPLEGDLIFETIEDKIYQITKVDTDTEALQSIRTNDMKFSYKVYVKQYTFSYKDTFDTNTEDEIFDVSTPLEVLEALNATLNQDITDLGIIGTGEDDIFGDMN